MADSNSADLTKVRLDAVALRVLAHPLRSRLLSQLRLEGPATATTLAARLHTNTGATSYHLRKLADVGLVEEADQGTARERWWRAAHDMHSFSAGDFVGDPDAEAALQWLQGEYHRRFVEHMDEWAREESVWPTEWRDAAGTSDYVLALTPAELNDLQRQIFDVVERYRLAGVRTGASYAEESDSEPRGGEPDQDAQQDEDQDRPQRSGRQRVLLYLHCFPEPRGRAR